MAVTMMNNMINPEVMGAMIEAKIEALAKLTPYAKVDTSLVGVPGDTKTVPSWNYIGDAEDVAEGAEVGLSQLTAASTTFTIKKAMKAVGFTDSGVPVWTQPLGASDAYMKGDTVSHNDKTWTSDIDNNVWEPGVYGWTEVTD